MKSTNFQQILSYLILTITLSSYITLAIRFPNPISQVTGNPTDQFLKTAVFSLGSFWRSESVFGCIDGVVRTTVGYAGGSKSNPEYRSLGDHAESVQIEYDPRVINFRQLLEIFWSSHDSRQVFGQGPDVGNQYRSIIFTIGTDESRLAALSKEREQTKSRSSIVTTQIQQLGTFYPAEPEHQLIMIEEKEPITDNHNGGVSYGEGTSSEGLRIYNRRKRWKMMSNSDDKIKAADVSAPNQDNHKLSFDAFTNGPGECSHRPCSNGHENGLAGCIQNTFVTHQESGFTPVIKKSLDNVERSDNQTNSSDPELSHVRSCESLKQSEGSTSAELCLGALSDILNSDKFSEVCGLLLKNFGVVNVNQVLNIDAISSKMKNGAYETSPMLYLKDIQQVWTKLQQVGNEMVTLASNLSDISRAHYDQCFRKPQETEAGGCQRCGEKAEVRNCIVCDSCEDIYHLSCTELAGTESPPSCWYCASCVSNGAASPHDNCVVCAKLKASASIPNGVPRNDQSQDVPNGKAANLHDVNDENHSSNICFMCKSEVKIGDDYKKCAHVLCAHKFHHSKCLTSKQLGMCGPYWYCPSCLCRRCLVDKDDDQIVLCDGCDEAYHMYCTSPQLLSIPKGRWFCRKCDRKVKGINTMKRVYESMQKKVKIEDGSEKAEHEEAIDEREGIDMLVTAAKRLSHPDAFWNTRSNIL